MWKYIANQNSVLKVFPNSDSLNALEVAKQTGRIVGDGDTLDLGGRTMTFVLLPFAHGADSMCVIDSATRVMMTGDEFDAGQMVGISRFGKEPNGDSRAVNANKNAKHVLDKYYGSFDFISGMHNSELIDKSFIYNCYLITSWLADADPSSPTYAVSFINLVEHMGPGDDSSNVNNRNNPYRFRIGTAAFTVSYNQFSDAENAILQQKMPAWLYDYPAEYTQEVPRHFMNSLDNSKHLYRPTDEELKEYGKVVQSSKSTSIGPSFEYWKLFPDVYMMALGRLFNLYIIKGEKCAVVIDTMETMGNIGLSSVYKDNFIRSSVERLVGKVPLKVVLSSAELQHLGNIEQFADCEFFASAKTNDALRAYGLKYKMNVATDGQKISLGSIGAPGSSTNSPIDTKNTQFDKFITFVDLRGGYLGVLDNYSSTLFAGNRINPVQVNLLGKSKSQIADYVEALNKISSLIDSNSMKYLAGGDFSCGLLSFNYVKTLRPMAQAILDGKTEAYKAHISDGAFMRPEWIFSDVAKKTISTNNKRVYASGASIIYSQDAASK